MDSELLSNNTGTGLLWELDHNSNLDFLHLPLAQLKVLWYQFLYLSPFYTTGLSKRHLHCTATQKAETRIIDSSERKEPLKSLISMNGSPRHIGESHASIASPAHRLRWL